LRRWVDYPQWGFSWSSPVFAWKYQGRTLKYVMNTSFPCFPMEQQNIIISFWLWCGIINPLKLNSIYMYCLWDLHETKYFIYYIHDFISTIILYKWNHIQLYGSSELIVLMLNKSTAYPDVISEHTQHVHRSPSTSTTWLTRTWKFCILQLKTSQSVLQATAQISLFRSAILWGLML
jgi:hypothetical protein